MQNSKPPNIVRLKYKPHKPNGTLQIKLSLIPVALSDKKSIGTFPELQKASPLTFSPLPPLNIFPIFQTVGLYSFMLLKGEGHCGRKVYANYSKHKTFSQLEIKN